MRFVSYCASTKKITLVSKLTYMDTFQILFFLSKKIYMTEKKLPNTCNNQEQKRNQLL